MFFTLLLSTSATHAVEVRSTHDVMENCQNKLYPAHVELEDLTKEFKTLSAQQGFERIRFRYPSRFPLPFLRHIVELMRQGDADFQRIMRACMATSQYSGDLDLYLAFYIYPVLELGTFNSDLSEENFTIFLARFKSEIISWGEKLIKTPHSPARFKELEAQLNDDILTWFREKKSELQTVIEKVKSHPELLPRGDADTRWAKRIQTFVREHIKTNEHLQPDEVQILDAVATWHEHVIEKKYITIYPPEKTRWEKLRDRFFGEKKPVWKPYQRLVPNVDLEPSDPLWLLNQKALASSFTFLNDHVSTKFDNFESLVRRGEVPTFASGRNWWWFETTDKTADVTGVTSKGLPKDFRGENYRRRFFWPKAMWGDPTFNRMRMALTETAEKKPLTLEVMVSADGIVWEPFYFHREGDLWVRDLEIDGMPIKQKCLQCHKSDGQGRVPVGELSPRPFFMKDEQAFLDVGYKHLGFIKKFLEY